MANRSKAIGPATGNLAVPPLCPSLDLHVLVYHDGKGNVFHVEQVFYDPEDPHTHQFTFPENAVPEGLRQDCYADLARIVVNGLGVQAITLGREFFSLHDAEEKSAPELMN